MIEATMPDPYTVFVQNLHSAYVEEQLELGYPRDQVLTLEAYSQTYRAWLVEQYKETHHG